MDWAKKQLSRVTQGQEEKQYPNTGIFLFNLEGDSTYNISEEQKISKW